VYVYPLFKDHSGNLWVGTEGFVDRFDPKSETFTHYRLNQLPANSLSKAVIHISEDSSGTLWLSTRNGLFSLDSNRRGMKRYFHDPTDPFSLGDSQIISSGEDRAGNFWVGTRISLDEFERLPTTFRAVTRASDETKRLTRYEFDWKTGRAQVNQAYSMLEDSDGTMWFGTAAAGVMKFDR